MVDAGGMGFVVILQGMLDEPAGRAPAPDEDEADKPAAGQGGLRAPWPTRRSPSPYDTVFIVRTHRGGEPLDEPTGPGWRQHRATAWSSARTTTAFKVHVHTNEPRRRPDQGRRSTARWSWPRSRTCAPRPDDLAAGKQAQSTDDLEAVEAELEADPWRAPESAAPEKKYGFVAVAAGEGLAAVFYDLGVDGVISGGQTMNPSTEDILKEIEKTPAEIVYVLPNNKNIIMAAQQCVRPGGGQEGHRPAQPRRSPRAFPP